MKLLLFLVIVWFVALAFAGCGATVRTPYGAFSYDQPAAVSDGKTALR